MIVHSARIEYKSGQTIRIRPIFDVHYGNRHCDTRAFKAFLSEDPDCRFIGGGDLMDSVITKDLKRYRKSADASEGDAIVDEQVGGMYEILKPYKDRILALGTGNHEDVITSHCGTNPMQRLCELLGVPFLGFSWLFKVVFACNGGHGRTVIIRGHHGWGGGSRTQGADLTKYSKDTAYWDADVFFYGHVHRLQSDRVPRLGLVGDKMLSKPKLIGLCGTFLKTFSDTVDPTYSEIKGYPPVEIGGLTLSIRPDHKWVSMKIDT